MVWVKHIARPHMCYRHFPKDLDDVSSGSVWECDTCRTKWQWWGYNAYGDPKWEKVNDA